MARPRYVDSKTPRLKASLHALIPAVAFLIQGTVGLALVAATGIAMAVSVVAGPRFSLFGVIARTIIRPVFKVQPGGNDEAAPHLFAEAVGAVFLIGSAAALAAGLTTLGWALTLIVVALATLNWLAGICVGCQMYLLIRRIGSRKVAA